MILIFSEKNSPRLEYICRLIFTDILGTEVGITCDYSHFRGATGHKINYSGSPVSDELFLKAGPFLFSDQVVLPEIQPVFSGEEPGFFETSPDSFLPFDPLASAFLVVSRMEEYLPGPRDKYGRFPAEESLLFRYGLLEKAMVNRWARLIARHLEKRYDDLHFSPSVFTFLPTIDVDNAWAFLHKGPFRTTAALFRDLLRGNLKEFALRLRVLAGAEQDPYFNFPYISDQFRRNNSDVVFFFLLGNYSLYDKPVPWRNRHLRKLISDLHRLYRTGLHPSWQSSLQDHQGLLYPEKERLEKIIREKVTRSRQHYLMLSFPETYRQLIKAGVKEDYTMGYPEMPGFRAGICTPFLFYDLAEERTTSLRIYPFQVMDVTFPQYLGLNAEKTLSYVKIIMEEINFTGGTFCYIWHNESLCGTGKWQGFREVFEEINQTGIRYAGKA